WRISIMAVTLDTFPVDIQPEYTRTLLTNAFEQSLVGQVVPSQPLTLGGQVIPIYDGGIEVGLTAEAAEKPTSDFTGRSATLSTAKVPPLLWFPVRLRSPTPRTCLTLSSRTFGTRLAVRLTRWFCTGATRAAPTTPAPTFRLWVRATRRPSPTTTLTWLGRCSRRTRLPLARVRTRRRGCSTRASVLTLFWRTRRPTLTVTRCVRRCRT